MVPAQLENFMSWKKNEGVKYFSCTYTDYSNRKVSGRCGDLPGIKNPNDYRYYIMDYHLEDENGFFDELLEKTGIDRSWVEFKTKKYHEGGGLKKNRTDPIDHTSNGWPHAKDELMLTNPKDTISQALPNIQTFNTKLKETVEAMEDGRWFGSIDEVAESYSVPVFMLSQAAESMNQVKKIGKEMKAKEKKELIITIASALVGFIPFLGELGAVAAGLSTVARVVALAGLAGNTAMTVVESVHDPDSAPIAIVALLLGGLPGGAGVRGTRTAEEFSAMSKLRQGIKADKMGTVFSRHEKAMRGILKKEGPA